MDWPIDFHAYSSECYRLIDDYYLLIMGFSPDYAGSKIDMEPLSDHQESL